MPAVGRNGDILACKSDDTSRINMANARTCYVFCRALRINQVKKDKKIMYLFSRAYLKRAARPGCLSISYEACCCCAAPGPERRAAGYIWAHEPVRPSAV